MKMNQILTEGYHKLPDSKLKKLLETKFSEAYNAYKKGNTIYRQDRGPSGEEVVFATPLKSRAAAYADMSLHNEYINNHAGDWSEAFPERSVIVTNSYEYALGRGSHSGTYVILPKNGTILGVCPEHDIWSSFKNINTLMSAPAQRQVLGYFYETPMRQFLQFGNMLGHDFRHQFYTEETLATSMEDFYQDCEDIDDLIERLKELSREEAEEQLNFSNTFVAASYEIITGGMEPSDAYQQLLYWVSEGGMANTFNVLFSSEGFQAVTINDVGKGSTVVTSNEIWFNAPYLMINIDFMRNDLPKLMGEEDEEEDL